MKKLGLIGYPLTHSFSEKYFSDKFKKEGVNDFSYTLFPLKHIDDFTTLCEAHTDLVGLNVTIPYKEKIIPFLDVLDESAEKIGAVNVIKFHKGRKIGFNTDYHGFKISLLKLIPKDYKGNALILGTGGASKAVEFALKDMQIDYQIASRTHAKGIAYDTIHKHPGIISKNQVIINTTPLGTYPEVEQKPDLPYNFINRNHFLHDLVYNPEETAFMKAGKAQGAQVKNGYEMLIEQAEKAWEIWNE